MNGVCTCVLAIVDALWRPRGIYTGIGNIRFGSRCVQAWRRVDCAYYEEIPCIPKHQLCIAGIGYL